MCGISQGIQANPTCLNLLRVNQHEATDTTAGASYLGPDENGLQSQQPYQNNGFAYPDPSGASAPAYPAFVDNSAYTNGDDIKSDLTAQLAAHNAGHALHQTNHNHNHVDYQTAS